MSAISALSGGSGIDLSSLRQNLFKQIDTNGNGKVSKDEFLAGRPKGVSESQAGELFAKIDSKGTGEVTQSELDSGLEKNKPTGGLASLTSSLSSGTLSALLQALSGNSSSSSTTTSTSSKNDDLASKIFSQIDIDHDGKVSKDEFVKGRPPFISESDASKQFDSIDKKGTGSITKDQFVANTPQPPSLGGSNNVSVSGNNDDLLQQLITAISSYTKNSYSNTSSSDISKLLSV